MGNRSMAGYRPELTAGTAVTKKRPATLLGGQGSQGWPPSPDAEPARMGKIFDLTEVAEAERWWWVLGKGTQGKGPVHQPQDG